MQDPDDKPAKPWHPPRPSWQYQIVEFVIAFIVVALLSAGATILFKLIF